MQKLKAEIELTIPAGYTLVENERLEQLETESLKGKTWSLEDFRKNCCGGKAPAWVDTCILKQFSHEITGKDGWLIPASGKGTRNIIFAKKACEWMENNHSRIDWNFKF